jgi:ATP-dependent RNA helicase DHX8/PRP22
MSSDDEAQPRADTYAAQLKAVVDGLPIAEHREDLIEIIGTNKCTVIIGETGSGKTTQLPQFLLDAKVNLDKGPILVSQPRRVAAVSVAKRVAEERGCRLGDEVGYHVRFDRCCRDTTAIRYVTDGVLLRECLADPTLSHYGVVVLDEAHVRSLETVGCNVVKR